MELKTESKTLKLETQDFSVVLSGLDALIRAGGQGLESSVGIIALARKIQQAANEGGSFNSSPEAEPVS